MELKDALKVVMMYSPCPHDNVDTNLGDGRTWASCYDCGNTFAQDNWQNYKDAAEAFNEAIVTLSEVVYATTP